MKQLESIKSMINKDENGEKFLHLEINEVVLIHFNIGNNNYQQKSSVLYAFIPNESFGQLLDILSKDFVFLKPFYSEFSYNEAWFTDQSSNPLKIEDKINNTLVINQNITYQDASTTCYSVKPKDQIFVRNYGFLSFAETMATNIRKNISKNLSSKTFTFTFSFHHAK